MEISSARDLAANVVASGSKCGKGRRAIDLKHKQFDRVPAALSVWDPENDL